MRLCQLKLKQLCDFFKMKKKLRALYYKYDLRFFRFSPIKWFYSAYLTLRYVNEWNTFPAIYFNSKVKLRFKKEKSSKLIIKHKIVFESFIMGESTTNFVLGANSTLIVEREFLFGNGIKVYLHENSTLLLKGKKAESASGITANSIIMVNKYLEIGQDCIIAWDTFLTDCDWHSVNGQSPSMETIIGDHVWIGVGVKILKGVSIGKNCIVTANSVVLKGIYPDQALISGSPAKVVKQNVPFWNRDMNSTLQ